MSLVLDSTLKVSLVILAGLASAELLRRHSASVRHWILATTLVCAAMVPFVEQRLPAWNVPPRAVASAAGSSGPPLPTDSENAVAAIDIAPIVTEAGAAPPRPYVRLVQTIALVGTGASFLILLVGLLRLTWLALRAAPIMSGRWAEIAREVEREYGLARSVALLASDHPSLLVTWGVFSPRVIVPRAALSWPDDRIRVVLRHELGHIQRADWIAQLAGEIVRAIYWFNPLIWIACTRLRDESERACDDLVLTTVDGAEYAAQLLALARALKVDSAPRVPAPAVARASSLERRIRAILDAHLVRTPATPTRRTLIAGAMMVLTIAIAAAQTGPTVLSGSVVDPTGAPVPGVRVGLTSGQTHARFEVTTDESGRYEFVPLPPDLYSFHAEYSGFVRADDTVRLSGRAMSRDVTLALKELRELVSVRGESVFRFENGEFVFPDGDRTKFTLIELRPEGANGLSGVVEMRAQGGSIAEASRSRPEECQPSATGGRLRAPRKIKDVKPVYPDSLRGSAGRGHVELSGTIALDGTVRNVSVTKRAHPDLDASALDAVRQWRFDGTLLNCRPVEARFSVTVDFGIQ